MQTYETIELENGQHNYYQLLRYLKNHGYKRVDVLDVAGEYNVQGDQITIIPAETNSVTKLDYFGDQLENIKEKKSQRHKIELKDNRLITEDGIVDIDGYLVHPQFGIALYRGRRIKKYSGRNKPFLCLEYAGNDQVYFPQKRESELMPYYGKKTPRLTRLHSAAWTKTKKRIEKDIYEIAQNLIIIQAKRKLVERPKYQQAKKWQKMLNKSFAHILTKDQVRAQADINVDLSERPEPMDRLLTGDVGFGKTEVAIRAATSVIESGKQVLVLVPTTVLAEQHYHVWSDRYKDFPVKIIKMSRISKTTKEEINKINTGKYDCIIGTHKVFSRELNFDNLGLLIIDEEQRFGVKQKEYFKSLRSKIDVLSLTATPIPRTLYMGLSGLRNMSTIKTAPGQRKGVQTKVTAYNKETIFNAIDREKKRDGQIYYVHNRVQTLPSTLRRIKDMVEPHYMLSKFRSSKKILRYAVAHGQTPSKKLERIMHQFFSGEIDMLITTSIIENGLDNPNANTLIVERAENFGLADLYQLRGRVGRRDKQAYALLVIGDNPLKGEKNISATAKARLEIIADSAKIGDGWSIALKDLEIRGAGTLLGKRQHGNMESIGLVLYSRLLKRAVEKMKIGSSKLNLSSDIVNLWKS